MPLVDRRTSSIVLRIVYDGPLGAGKATNLRQLCDRLPLGPRSPLDGPGAHEHGQVFDWLDATGRVGGHRVRCQLVIVPAELQLARRRRNILDGADAVVFVADARPGAAPDTGAALRSLVRGLGTRADVPLVLQANKQDLPNAQPPAQLHAALGLAARVPVIGAHAIGGSGVIETFRIAVRLAVDHVRALLVAGELGESDPTGTAELLAALAADAPGTFDALDAIVRAADAAAAAEPVRDATGGAPDATATCGPGGAQSGETTERSIAAIHAPVSGVVVEAALEASRNAATRPIRVIPRPRIDPAAEVRATRAESASPARPVGEPASPAVRVIRCAPVRMITARALAADHGHDAASEASAAPAPMMREAKTRPIRVIRHVPVRIITAAAALPDQAVPDDIIAPPPSDPALLLALGTAPVAVGVALGSGQISPPPPMPAPAPAPAPPSPPPRSRPASAAEQTELFFGTDDDATWDLPAVEPSGPVAAPAHGETSAAASDEPGRTTAAATASPTGLDAPGARDPAAPLDAATGPRIEVTAAATAGLPAPATLGLPPPPDPLPFQLPPADLPADMVWPDAGGRAVLATLGAPVRQVARPRAWAPAAAIELECRDGWSAHSSAHLVFSDLDHGRRALFDAARWQAKLGHLTPPARTYALSFEGTRVRLWVLTPPYRTVWAAVEEAFERGDHAAAGQIAKAGLGAVDQIRARGVAIADLDHIAIDDPPRLLATPWTPQRDRLIVQLQRLLAAAVL